MNWIRSFSIALMTLVCVSGVYAQSLRASPYATEKCPYVYASWNIANLSTNRSPENLEQVARVIGDMYPDVLAIQEVTAGKDHGSKAVALLVDSLSRKGKLYDYIVSDPTKPASPSVERYAYLVRRGVLFNRKSAHLVFDLQEKIEREPYSVVVTFAGKEVTLFTLHAVPTAKKPEQEIAQLLSSVELQATSGASIFSGDFNLPYKVTDITFQRLQHVGNIRGMTSLRDKLTKQGSYLSRQYDNIYTKGMHVCSGDAYDFVKKYFSPVTNESLRSARRISDHLPVYVTFGFDSK